MPQHFRRWPERTCRWWTARWHWVCRCHSARCCWTRTWRAGCCRRRCETRSRRPRCASSTCARSAAHDPDLRTGTTMYASIIYYTMLTSLTRNALILSGGRGLRLLWLRPGNRHRAIAGAPSADSGSPLATGTHDEWSTHGFATFLNSRGLCYCRRRCAVVWLEGRWPGRHADPVGWTGEDRYANSIGLSKYKVVLY